MSNINANSSTGDGGSGAENILVEFQVVWRAEDGPFHLYKRFQLFFTLYWCLLCGATIARMVFTKNLRSVQATSNQFLFLVTLFLTIAYGLRYRASEFYFIFIEQTALLYLYFTYLLLYCLFYSQFRNTIIDRMNNRLKRKSINLHHPTKFNLNDVNNVNNLNSPPGSPYHAAPKIKLLAWIPKRIIFTFLVLANACLFTIVVIVYCGDDTLESYFIVNFFELYNFMASCFLVFGHLYIAINYYTKNSKRPGLEKKSFRRLVIGLVISFPILIAALLRLCLRQQAKTFSAHYQSFFVASTIINICEGILVVFGLLIFRFIDETPKPSAETPDTMTEISVHSDASTVNNIRLQLSPTMI